MKYICAQPAITYYTWQVEVMINNFIKMGVNPNDIEILVGLTTPLPNDWSKLQQAYPYVRFFFYSDTRHDKNYPPSIYFHLLKKHFKANPHLEDEVLFIHDSDIVFTKTPNFQAMEYGKVWYMSDTSSYLNYDYIQQKGNYIYEKMCNIVGIDWRIPKLMNINSGGAQYIVKNTNYEFWDKVEKDSIDLYEWFCKDEPLFKKKNPNVEPIQKWTAGMWSFLWNAWYFGHQTLVDKRLGFGWVINDYNEIERYSILHNAGVESPNNGLFHKGSYINRIPYNDILNLDQSKASYFYWQQIQETKTHTCLI